MNEGCHRRAGEDEKKRLCTCDRWRGRDNKNDEEGKRISGVRKHPSAVQLNMNLCLCSFCSVLIF